MDVNDSPPLFSESSYTAFVAENSEIGAIITILTATDDDEGNHGQVTNPNVMLFLYFYENVPLSRSLNICSGSLFRSSTA